MKSIWKAKIFVLTALVIFSCSEDEKKKEEVRPVRVQVVAEVGSQTTRTFSGVAQPGVETKLSFKVSGSSFDY